MNHKIMRILDAHLHVESENLHFNPDREYFINGTYEGDWKLIIDYSRMDNITGFIGIHPWYIERTLPGWEKRLEDTLLANPHLGVGEFGLDRIRKEVPLEKQLYFFEIQLDLALKFNKPVVIHCVKAYDLLFEQLKKRNIQQIHGILHRFETSKQVMNDLLERGFYISFFYTLQTREKVQEAFKNCDPAKILLESDAGDGPDDEALDAHYRFSAQLLGITPDELIQRTTQNGQIFKNPPFSG